MDTGSTPICAANLLAKLRGIDPEGPTPDTSIGAEN
jgi:hypothetical protein